MYDWKISARKALVIAAFGAAMALGHHYSDQTNADDAFPPGTADAASIVLVAGARWLRNWAQHRAPATSVDDLSSRPVLQSQEEMDAFIGAYQRLVMAGVPWEDARKRALHGVLQGRVEERPA